MKTAPTLAIEISPDKLEAHLILHPEDPGLLELNEEAIKSALQNEGVCAGIDDAAIRAAVASLNAVRSQSSETRVCVARGTAPQSATKAEFTLLHQSGELVGMGTVLGRLLAGHPSRAGQTVTGEELSAAAGTNGAAPQTGPNVCYVVGQKRWEALVAGFTVIESGVLSVTPLVRIASDGMVAELTLPALPKGTDPPGKALLLAQIQASGVVFGLLEDSLRAAVELFTAQPETGVTTAIARGMPRIPGRDGALDLAVLVGSRAGQVTQDGRVDYHRQGLGRDVQAGDLLATIQPPRVGSAGMTVTGQELPARPGKELQAVAGSGVRASTGGAEFRAEIDGIFFATDGHLKVLRSYEVEKDVCFATGDIETCHEVNIRGSIMSSFSVRAGGPIFVGAHVEDAVVVSAASIEVKGGISHRKFGSVRARGAVEAKYAQNAEIQSGDSINLGNSSYHSFLVAKESLRLVSGKGSIVGGQAIAGHSIKVKVAGTRQGIPTILRVGYDYLGVQQVEKKLRRLEQQMADLLSMAGANLLNFTTEDHPKPSDKRTAKALARWNMLERRRQGLFAMRDRLLQASAEALPGAPTIEVLDEIYPGVQLIVGSHALLITRLRGGGKFGLNRSTNEVEQVGS